MLFFHFQVCKDLYQSLPSYSWNRCLFQEPLRQERVTPYLPLKVCKPLAMKMGSLVRRKAAVLDGRYINIFLVSRSFKRYTQHLLASIWLSLELDLAECKHGGKLLPVHCSIDSPIHVQEASLQDPTSPPNRRTEHVFVGAVMGSHTQKHMDSL